MLRARWVIMLEILQVRAEGQRVSSGTLKPCISHLGPGSIAQLVVHLTADPGGASSNPNLAS